MTRPTDRRPNESPEDTVADNYNAAGCGLWRFRGSGTGKTEENFVYRDFCSAVRTPSTDNADWARFERVGDRSAGISGEYAGHLVG